MSWSRIQSAAGSVGFGSSHATYGSNVSSGSKLIATAVTEGSGITTSTVKDGASNSFTKILAQSLGGTRGELSLWAIDTPAGDVGTTPTITATASSGTNTYCMIQEVSGLKAGTTVAVMCDGTPGGVNGGAGGSPSSGTLPSPTYSSAASSEYLLSATTFSTDDFVAPSNLTADPDNIVATGGAFGLGLAYGNSTGGTESAAWTYTTAFTPDQYGVILVAFKLSSTAHTATAALTVTPSFSAARTRGKHRTAALTVTPSFSAARVRGKHRSGGLTVSPSFSAARTHGHGRPASLLVVPGFSVTTSAEALVHASAFLSAEPALVCSTTTQRITICPGNLPPSGPGIHGPLATGSYVTVPGLSDGIYDT